jgi:ribonuclease R
MKYQNPKKKQNFSPRKTKNTKKYYPKKTYTGTVTLTRAGFGLVYIEDLGQKVEIESKFLKTALNRDTVEIAVIGKSKAKGTIYGEVLNIIRRSKKGFAGKLIKQNNAWFVKTDDSRMDFNIMIPEKDRNDAREGEKVFTVIYSWEDRKTPPIGRIEKVLGAPGNIDSEMHGIALEKGFDWEFPPEVEAETKKIHRESKNDGEEKRKDIRGITTFTIDPFDAKDFDDALSIQFLGDGKYEIGIHIADVSHYVRPGTALDKEAYNRATSVYLVDRTIPMLPELLSNDLCSLNPNEDKKTFSAIFTMNDKGEVLSEWFGRTLIHSDKRFTYEEAQEIIEQEKGLFKEEIVILNKIAKKLTEGRFRNGALSLESDEVKFKLNEEGKPIAVTRKERKDAHKMIEEFMLLANKRVAAFCGLTKEKKTRLAIYRIHDKPSREKTDELVRYLTLFGYQLTLNKGLLEPKEINAMIESIPPLERSPIQTMVIRSMQKAKYSTKNIGHFGLGFLYYTHFTSPIRRYPDIMAHRILATYLEGSTIPSKYATIYETQCEHASFQEKEAMEAERQSVKIKQAEYMSERIGQTFSGVVTGLTPWGLYVEEVESKSEGMISLRDMNDDIYVLNEEKFVIRGESNGRELRLGDTISISVKSVNLDDYTIDYSLL